MNIQSFIGDSHWIMDIHPGSRHLAELVVHVVSLVEEQLQNKAMGRPCHCHLSHLDCIDMTFSLDLELVNYLFSINSRIKSIAISVFRMIKTVPITLQKDKI